MSFIVWLVVLIPLVFFFIFFGMQLVFISLPFVPPIIIDLLYGYKTSQRGITRGLISVILGFGGGLWFLFFARLFCGVDGGAACEPGVFDYLYSGVLAAIASPFVVYIGVFIRYLFKDEVVNSP